MYVVVRAELEAEDAIDDVAAGAGDDHADRRGLRQGFQSLAELQAVELWQLDIDEHEIRKRAPDRRPRAKAIGRAVRDESGVAQAADQQPREPGVVLDDEDAVRHGFCRKYRQPFITLQTSRIQNLPMKQSSKPVGGLATSPVPDRRIGVRERLIASEQCYRLLFEHHPQPMAIYEPASMRFLDVNEAAIGLYGYSKAEFLGMTVRDLALWPAEPAPLTGAADATGVADATGAADAKDAAPAIRKHVRKDRTPIDVEVSSRELLVPEMPAPVQLLAIRDHTERLRGETERKILEAQFRQAQKLEPVRRLAGGIAHDFNNLLTILLGYAEWLETREGLDPRSAEAAREIHHASESASVLVRQLLAFSRREAVRPRIVNMNEAMEDMSQVLRHLIGEDIELRTRAGAKEATVTIDPGQLEQIVLNLAVNAREAMPDGGTLTLETQNVVREDGAYVRLSVRDSGAGMNEDIGKGTGLGLAAIYGIVNQNRGAIAVDANEDSGTCFKIDLPYAKTPTPKEAARAKTDETDEIPPLLRTAGGDEWVLVVEDDARLRSLTEQILATRGYHVLSAAHAREALTLIERHRAKLSLLLTDVVLPGTNGRELANRALKTCPALSVIYMSGYTDEAALHRGSDTPEAFLGKPFTAVGLLELVRATLDAGKARATSASG
jgi:two-component system, cell cycle sensor histidine kinase and response regulator CckA